MTGVVGAPSALLPLPLADNTEDSGETNDDESNDNDDDGSNENSNDNDDDNGNSDDEEDAAKVTVTEIISLEETHFLISRF